MKNGFYRRDIAKDLIEITGKKTVETQLTLAMENASYFKSLSLKELKDLAQYIESEKRSKRREIRTLDFRLERINEAIDEIYKKQEDERQALLNLEIEKLGLSKKVVKCLRDAKIKFIGEICSLSKKELYSATAITISGMKEVENVLKSLGLQLEDSSEDGGNIKRMEEDLRKTFDELFGSSDDDYD